MDGTITLQKRSGALDLALDDGESREDQLFCDHLARRCLLLTGDIAAVLTDCREDDPRDQSWNGLASGLSPRMTSV